MRSTIFPDESAPLILLFRAFISSLIYIFPVLSYPLLPYFCSPALALLLLLLLLLLGIRVVPARTNLGRLPAAGRHPQVCATVCVLLIAAFVCGTPLVPCHVICSQGFSLIVSEAILKSIPVSVLFSSILFCYIIKCEMVLIMSTSQSF